MLPLLADAVITSLSLIVVAAITIIPATLGAIWARSARTNSAQANANSEETRQMVVTNGGMGSVDPNLNDHIKYQTEMLETVLERTDLTDQRLEKHINHSRIMDQALAEVYLVVKPDMNLDVDKL